MKQKYFLKCCLLSLLIVFATLFANCSGDDDTTGKKEEEITTPSEVFQNQVVTIELTDTVPEDEYTGTFNGTVINLIRSGERSVMFQVPFTASGDAELTVKDLSISIFYTVKETALPGTPEETLAPLFADIATFSQQIEAEATEEAALVTDVIDAFNAYYETLSDEEKHQLAVYYRANDELFNSIINPEADNTSGTDAQRLTFNIDTQLLKHKIAALALGGGAAVVWLAPDPVEKAAGALLAYIAWKKCKNYLNEIMVSKLRKINVAFGDMLSELSNRPESGLVFINGQAQSFVFSMQQRNIEADDTNSDNEGLGTFFTSHLVFSEAVDKVNGVIEFVNDNLFFSNIDLIPVYTMPDSQPAEIIPVDETIFDALQFASGNENVALTTGFEDGNIHITLSINDTENMTEDYIATSINYTYEDALNSLNGSFPVTVSLSQPSIFTDALAVQALLAANNLDVSDPRWTSDNESEVTAILVENGASITEGRVTALVIRQKALTELPADIAGLTELKNLNLGYNALTTLPPEIGNMHNLTTLSLYDNNLTSIPSEIGNLITLKKLELDGNNLSALPETLWGLTNLTWLSTGGNNLAQMPAGIGNLTQLTSLGWSTNGLAAIPPEIKNLSSLNALSLERNKLTTLPAEIGSLTNLTVLGVEENTLTSLPPEMGNMTSLVGNYAGVFNLSNNRLTTIPAEIVNLTNITQIRLGNNLLTEIPAEISTMNLNVLDVEDNETLLCLPAAVWNSSTIQRIEHDDDVWADRGKGISKYGDIDCSK
ncbi:leucine-rich repeat domain-containing protein [Sinomicrobium soli]|uniref:leucine-rich repeat domain-containing protein n=1 Tax=Sinomicrobium sp. N-1-3-6 TaxID=2219864 RepID=UPI000DCD0E57|nr:leucine-rich repeat domain-containing protein [Sinomicrobium sp. N-1-3-6]RAV28462.1 hypothetical protein DN748_13870 [Sinomicrobium sp. N-1-3-6]